MKLAEALLGLGAWTAIMLLLMPNLENIQGNFSYMLVVWFLGWFAGSMLIFKIAFGSSADDR